MRLFVAMPYGQRRQPLLEGADPVQIDFDDVWAELIRPAIPADWEAYRADERSLPGPIDAYYLESLLEAEIVLADVTFGNANVCYELGIRQALSPAGSVLIKHAGYQLPFDLRNQNVIEYHYVDGRPTDGVRFVNKLKDTLDQVAEGGGRSPVHIFLPGLSIRRGVPEGSDEERVQELQKTVERLGSELILERSHVAEQRFLEHVREANNGPRLVGLIAELDALVNAGPMPFERLAIKLRQHDRIQESIACLGRGLTMHPDDPILTREMGFCYRLTGQTSEARRFLSKALDLSPADPELLGMLGGLEKRENHLSRARDLYERAHRADPSDRYPLVALAGCLALLGEELEAQKRYVEVLQLTNAAIEKGGADYWTFMNRAEAYVALNDLESAQSALDSAQGLGPPPNDWDSFTSQLQALAEASWRRDLIASLHLPPR